MKLKLLIENDLRVHLFYPDDTIDRNGVLEINDLVIFVPGLPQTVDKTIGELFTREGKACAVIYYYGSWYSGGTFLPSESRRSLVDAIAMLCRGNVLEAYGATMFRFTFRHLSVIANSYGAQVFLTSDIDYSLFNNINLFAPFLSVHKDDNPDNIISTIIKIDLPFWRRGLNNIYRGIELPEWDNYFNGYDVNSKLKNIYPKISLIVGSNDSVISKNCVQLFQSKYLASVEYISEIGHDFVSLYEKYKKL